MAFLAVFLRIVLVLNLFHRVASRLVELEFDHVCPFPGGDHHVDPSVAGADFRLDKQFQQIADDIDDGLVVMFVLHMDCIGDPRKNGLEQFYVPR